MKELKGACIIGQSGGPTSVINASAYGVIRTALDSDVITNVYGAEHGIKGVLNDRLFDMSKEDAGELELLKYTPSSALGSCRYKMKDPDEDDTDYKRILEVFKKHDVRYFFYNGGNDSMDTCNKISKFMQKSGYECRVMGVPKTIDNDLSFIDSSFGFDTAVASAVPSVRGAHVEAKNSINGIGLVKVMGRESGYIAAHTSLAQSDVNFCLIPESPFDLDGPNGLLEHVKRRILERGHAVILVAEGAGQEFAPPTGETDASGNIKYHDIGIFLKDKLKEYFRNEGIPTSIKYIDPSYIIRSAPANSYDSIYCARLGAHAVHAAMAGKTQCLVSRVNNQFVYLPIKQAVSKRSHVDIEGTLWRDVLENTRQPFSMKN